MEKELIKLTGIYKSFAGVQALQNVDFTIREGEVRCLAGENGSGKSTLIKVIAGFYEPDSGSIEINGKTFEKLTPKQAIREGVQIIYQDFAVFPNLTVAENIAITSEYNEGKALINWKSMRARASGIMQELGIDLDPDAILGRLSVADKQLVAICRALVQQAKLLIMDEPTTALTKKEVSSLFRLVLKLREKGIAILFVSHKLEEVFEIAETITILRNGKLVTEGAMRDFDADKFAYTAGVTFRPIKWMNIDIAYGYVNSADPERTGSYPYTNSVLGIVNEKLAAAGIPESQLTNPVTDFSGNYTARAHTFSIGVGFSF